MVPRLTLLVLFGCRGSLDTERSASWLTAGTLCVVPTEQADAIEAGTLPASVSYEAGVPLSAIVVFSECEACASPFEASCTVEEGGEPRTVASEASYIVPPECLEEGCERVTTRCDVGTLEEGSFSFEHGGTLLVIEVPSMAPAYCAGEPTAPDLFPE